MCDVPLSQNFDVAGLPHFSLTCTYLTNYVTANIAVGNAVLTEFTHFTNASGSDTEMRLCISSGEETAHKCITAVSEIPGRRGLDAEVINEVLQVGSWG